ncbi:hypothetical protein BHM03_00026439 [Ensete ventricosum]|uniref:Uncharacterized protein n=1 Tax=Ensete ventricosum TaxID=4639 RepID=A0A445MH77_ENSVE|nr:hypothetical protein BHM03_00026439 [Ensete ventricosum]
MRARHASDDTKLQPQTWAEERGNNFRLPSGLRLRCVAELSSSAVRRHPSHDATDKTTRSNTKQRPPCRYLQLYHHHANVVPASSGQGELRQYDGGLLSSVFSSAVRHLPHQLSAEALPRDLADHLVGDDVPQPIAGQNQELVFLRPVELQGFVCVCIYTLWSEESGTAMSPRESTALESPQLATTIRSGPTTATDAVDPTSISSDASSPSTLEKLMAITSLHCSSALGHSPNAATSSASTTWSRSRHAHATLTPQCPSYTPKKSYSGAVPTDANLGATVTASSISLLRPISDTDPWDKQGAIPLLALWASEPKLRFRFLTRLAGQPPELASALIQRSWRRRWRIVFTESAADPGKSSGPSKCGDPVMLCVTLELERLLHDVHVRGHGAFFYVLIEYVGEEKRSTDRQERQLTLGVVCLGVQVSTPHRRFPCMVAVDHTSGDFPLPDTIGLLAESSSQPHNTH